MKSEEEKSKKVKCPTCDGAGEVDSSMGHYHGEITDLEAWKKWEIYGLGTTTEIE